MRETISNQNKIDINERHHKQILLSIHELKIMLSVNYKNYNNIIITQQLGINRYNNNNKLTKKERKSFKVQWQDSFSLTSKKIILF